MAEMALRKSVQVHLRIQKRCMFGDFDALKLDMQYSRNAHVALSLVSADGSREYTQEVFAAFKPGADTKDLPRAIATLFQEGERTTIALPDNLGDGVYALVLCKVSKGKEGCSGTPVVDVHKVLDTYKQSLSEYHVVEDHVYFYQPLVVSGGKIKAYRRTITPENLEHARSVMTEAGMVVDEDTESVLQRAAVAMSNPVALFSDEVVVNLPVYSKVKCEG
jgi:hypothetical protein